MSMIKKFIQRALLSPEELRHIEDLKNQKGEESKGSPPLLLAGPESYNDLKKEARVTINTLPSSREALSMAVSDMPITERLIVEASLTTMMNSSFFSICTINEVMELLEIPKTSKAYGQLRALHCTDFKSMPKELRELLPHLINEAFQKKGQAKRDIQTILNGIF